MNNPFVEVIDNVNKRLAETEAKIAYKQTVLQAASELSSEEGLLSNLLFRLKYALFGSFTRRKAARRAFAKAVRNRKKRIQAISRRKNRIMAVYRRLLAQELREKRRLENLRERAIEHSVDFVRYSNSEANSYNPLKCLRCGGRKSWGAENCDRCHKRILREAARQDAISRR